MWLLQIPCQKHPQKQKCQNKIFAFCQIIISGLKIIFISCYNILRLLGSIAHNGKGLLKYGESAYKG
ncbi:MAG: hypothetical protein CFE25_14010 [Chitinophagaceae bacterium BSSC1]|nr:MAG: hypothetical protein CFE25_14010 [Chitinophagaceae bacterium BSSC1]